MDDKTLTPQESMALITQMIETSKQRVAMPDLRISVMWAALSILTAATVLSLSLIHYSPWINFIWLAIPVIGLPVNFWLIAKKSSETKSVKTAIDSISDGIWKTVGIIAIVLTIVCIIFNILGHPSAWLAMLYYAFIVVGFGATMQGIVLKENSYVFGGIFSVIAGFLLIILNINLIPLLITWVIPLYIVCFLMMFIVPAFVIRKKINSAKR